MLRIGKMQRNYPIQNVVSADLSYKTLSITGYAKLDDAEQKHVCLISRYKRGE